MRGITMTLAQVEAYNARHGFESSKRSAVPKSPIKSTRHGQNKTEAEFALILEAQKRKGEILRYEYEGITLRWAGIRYTPDFVVTFPFIVTHLYTIPKVKFIEVKGGYIKGKFERAIERFRHARTYWPEFSFEMHQKTKSGWQQIY